MDKKLVIGTRGSKLALEQSNIVKKNILKKNHDFNLFIKVVKTKGDLMLSQSVQNLVDKGFFVNEIQNELVKNNIDISVHSLKDLPTKNNSEVMISSIPKRDSALDVLISKNNKSVHDLPNDSIIATSSIRRKYQLLKINPFFKIKEIRGNIDTRINKLDNGFCDALVLAEAGLNRLNLQHRIAYYFKLDEMIPAAGQGAIAVESRKNDDRVLKILNQINDFESYVSTSIERSLLTKFGLGCNAPVAAYAQFKNRKIYFTAMLFSLKKMKDITISISDDICNYKKISEKAYNEFVHRGYKELLNE